MNFKYVFSRVLKKTFRLSLIVQRNPFGMLWYTVKMFISCAFAFNLTTVCMETYSQIGMVSLFFAVKWHFRVTVKNIKIQDFENKVSEVLMYTKY